MIRLENLLKKIESIGEAPPESLAESALVGRLLVPNQILRFPDAGDLDQFVKAARLREGDYVKITYSDPLGFDDTFYAEGRLNPKNYLRRNQLPNLHIDMTNVYRPWVEFYENFMQGSFSWYMPALATESSESGASSNLYIAPSLPLKPGWGVYVSAMTNAPDGLASVGIREDTMIVNACRAITPNQINTYYPIKRSQSRFVTVWSYANSYQFETTMTAIFPSSFPSSPVHQSTDHSSPSLGFFWFNDGNYPGNPFGQIELPKDSRCRTQVIIKILRLVVVR